LKQSLLPIPDHRRAQGKLYDLPHRLLFSSLAVMSGATSYRRIHQFIRTHQARLNEVFGCRWQRPPADTSIRYTLRGLDPEQVATHFRAHAAGLVGDAALIALDGKALRGRLDRFEDRQAAQVLSAFAVEERVVLGQVRIEDASKDHEIQAAQRLIKTLDLEGRLYTLEPSIFKKTVETVLATGSHLLVQLKANHPKLLAAVRGVCRPPPRAERDYQVDLGRRNRIEQRTARGWPRPEGAGTEPWHDHFKAVVEVRRRVEGFNPSLRRFVPRKEPVAYYLATRTASAHTLAQASRSHWAIENSLHHVLDVSFGEDASRIRRNPGVFAQLRHFALNLLRHHGQAQIRAALYDHAISLERVLNYTGIKH
jgi:predicted transposase YbfD/YdcC